MTPTPLPGYARALAVTWIALGPILPLLSFVPLLVSGLPEWSPNQMERDMGVVDIEATLEWTWIAGSIVVGCVTGLVVSLLGLGLLRAHGLSRRLTLGLAFCILGLGSVCVVTALVPNLAPGRTYFEYWSGGVLLYLVSYPTVAVLLLTPVRRAFAEAETARLEAKLAARKGAST